MKRGQKKKVNLNKKNKKKQKSGLSTVITTMIIILISLVAIGVFWIVVRNVLNSGTQQISLEKFTIGAKILNVNLYNDTNNVSLNVERNSGAGQLEKLSFVFSDGATQEAKTQSVSLKELEQQSFMFHLDVLDVDNLKSVSIPNNIYQPKFSPELPHVNGSKNSPEQSPLLEI